MPATSAAEPGSAAGRAASPAPGPGPTSPQGRTGLRLILTAAADGTLAATFDFYPVDGEAGVPSGSLPH